ncbi:MAG: carboxypeptidase regulatory-like domain-containing protein [Proteobacteria bacterium]|nr:carboxypeptidase regulatory-like domain-containing protein [Pseudomonadota bacterium]
MGLLLLSPCVYSTDGSIGGTIVADGQPVAGAMITALAQTSRIAITVFSAADGSYRIQQLGSGSYDVAVKAPGKKTLRQTQTISAGKIVRFDSQLQSDPEFLTEITSAQWLELLPEGDMKREFLLNCGSCHEVSHNRIMRNGAPRTRSEWAQAIALMRSIDVYGLTPPDFDDARYAQWLAEHLDAQAIARLTPAALPSGAVLNARITEYPVPKTPSLPHDLVIGPDGRVWVTAFYNNVIWALDPATGKTTSYPVNETPEVMGQVRALSFDSEGMLWVLLGGTQSVVRLNPKDGAIETFAVGMYPHSIEVDSTGKLWFNDYISNQERIGSIDPVNGELELFDMPSAGLTKEQGLPLLYGLQIDRDDAIWGTMLAANKLFRFDSKDKTARLFAMPSPNSGPRRPGIAPDGSVWIPEFNTGTVTRFDPQSETFEPHEFGLSSLGLYDVAVDQKSGHVWAAASLGSAMLRLDPKTGQKDVFPFPTEPGYPRHIAIDPNNGDVWTTLSSMPDADPKIVRIELSGGTN